jgi:hypothetical protein
VHSIFSAKVRVRLHKFVALAALRSLPFDSRIVARSAPFLQSVPGYFAMRKQTAQTALLVPVSSALPSCVLRPVPA